jgi:hypothetical protein
LDNISFDTMTETPSAPEPVVKQGGNSEISDDEMVSLSSDESTPKEKAKRELATKVDSKGREEKDEASAGKKAAKEVAAEEAASQELKAKILKIKHGDTELDLAEDAMVPVKVAGEIVQVPVKDLLANYSGKTDWTKKYNALHEERTSFYTERDTVNSRINEIHDLAVTQKNPRLAIERLAEAMGADPTETWNSLITPIKEAMKSLPNISPEELAAREKEEELEYYKSKESWRKQEAEKSRINEDLVSRIKTTQSEHGMTPEQFKASYDEMVKEARRSGFNEADLTPEMVGQYFQMTDRQDQVSKFVQETYAESEKKSDIYGQLLETWKRNPEFSLDDLKEIASEVFGTTKAKSARLAERVTKTKTTQKALPQVEPMSWDEL